MKIIITNNPMVRDRLLGQSSWAIEFYDTNYLGVLKAVRDKIHLGYGLLTHPLSGSVKPNESPYKSLLISENPEDVDPQSVSIIEESILTVRKFPKKHISEQCLHDLQTVDLALIQSAL